MHILATTIRYAEGGGALEGLGINLVQILAQIVNFLLIMYFLNGALVRPVLKNLDARRKKIDDSMENARLAEEKLANIGKDYQAKMQQAAANAQKLRPETLQGAQSELDRLRKEARADAEKIRAQAQIDATAQRNQMLGDLRGQVAAISMAAANKIVGESLDANRQKALINDFFGKVPAGVSVSEGGAVSVTSALPLSADEQAKVKADLGKQIANLGDVSFDVNPSILGGLIVRVGDKVIDGSVAAKMTALRQSVN